MRRREFITFLGGATVSWPLVARAQQDGRVRLVGWLDNEDENEASLALRTSLRELGWIEGRNLRVEIRFVTGDPDRLRTFAAEIVSLKPDAIVAGGAAPARALQQVTHTIPIIFTRGGDAAVIGLVGNIARPDGNITGFSSSEPSIGGKWLELLKRGRAGHRQGRCRLQTRSCSNQPKVYSGDRRRCDQYLSTDSPTFVSRYY